MTSYLEHIKKQKIELLKIGIIQSETTLVFGIIVNTPLDSSNILKELKKSMLALGSLTRLFMICGTPMQPVYLNWVNQLKPSRNYLATAM